MDNPDRRYIYVEMAFFWRWWNEQSDDMRNTVKQLVNEGSYQSNKLASEWKRGKHKIEYRFKRISLRNAEINKMGCFSDDRLSSKNNFSLREIFHLTYFVLV